MRTAAISLATALLTGAPSASHAAPPYGWDNTGNTMTILPLSGIDQVTSSTHGQAQIFSTRGICKFRIELAAEQSATISFLYSSLRSFVKIEGVDVVDNATETRLNLEDLLASRKLHRDGGTIRIEPQDSSLNWTVQVIDYYR